MHVNNVNDLISIVECSTYMNAFKSMRAYFLYIDYKKIHSDLDTIALFLYKKYALYNTLIEKVLHNINSTDLVKVINISHNIYIDSIESYSLHDYTIILSHDDYMYITTLFDVNIVESLNILIGLNKYNELYHRIKDYFIPLYCK